MNRWHKKLVVILTTMAALFGIGVYSASPAGAAVDQNVNWWLDGKGGALHVAADHHTDGVWHVRATLYEYGTGNSKGTKLNLWFEDWACPSVKHGIPYETPAEVHIRTDGDMAVGPNYCTNQGYYSYRPPLYAGDPKPNGVREDWGSWDWVYDPYDVGGSGSCFLTAENTGLHQYWWETAITSHDGPCTTGFQSNYVFN